MQLEPAKILQPLSKFKIKPKVKFKLYEDDQLQFYFSNFRLKCYLLMLFSPIGLGISAYLFSASFSMDTVGLGIGLFLVGILLLFPWTFVPLLYLFTTFHPNTWKRKVSWGYVCVLVIALAYWIYYFS
ncbi:hypothetical protein [Litchfieldia salsa]|uniref:Uncharacterized protein n=1 Tax=Litchfieldia salsa TaxID=930152 RepID=A0A1H0VSK1_9BACI|nr:hypothetical protein [Litchfieldia salsa]SDP81155.1 hypothetical protein SAMN05216565_107181 [Litchfieldia salsa]